MKNKMIVALSLVTSGVMTYLMFSGLDEDFYHFPWELFAGFGMMSWLIRDVKRDQKNDRSNHFFLYWDITLGMVSGNAYRLV